MQRLYYNQTTREWIFRIAPANYLSFHSIWAGRGFGIHLRRHWGGSERKPRKNDNDISWVLHFFWFTITWSSIGAIIKDFPGWPKEWKI